jgi:uncharacterized membrane protein
VIEGRHVVDARISMSPASGRRSQFSVRSGGRSLLLKFSSLECPGQEITIGAAISTADDSAIEPGIEDSTMRLWFWANEGQVYATPGARFVLWYAGRTVGQGEVLRVIDEVADR